MTALALSATALMYAASPAQRAAAERPSPDEVEAAYLYNFGKFVHWPSPAAQGPMVLCVTGQDSLTQILERLVAGEQVQGRALEVRQLARPEEAGTCSILFVGAGERERLSAFLAAASGKPVLTVGDAPDFLARGGIIQFVLTGNHVRFSVNLNAANQNGVQLSSELLKVAVSVTGRPEIGELQ